MLKNGKTKLFVYGTLLTGHGNWRWLLAPQKGVPNKLQFARLYHLGGYPGMIKSFRDEEIVRGEVFEVDEEQLTDIDRLEGYSPDREVNTFYARELVTLMDGTGAYTYFYQGEPPPNSLIISGDWNNIVLGKEI